MPPRLAAHLEERGCLPVLYMSSWLLTVFASAFPLSFASRVMDVLLTDSYSEPMMRVSTALYSPGGLMYALRVPKAGDVGHLCFRHYLAARTTAGCYWSPCLTGYQFPVPRSPSAS